MNRPRGALVVEALATALGRIGSDSTWCTAPAYVGREVTGPAFEALPRPAVLVGEPTWADYAPETMGGTELGAADLEVPIYLVAGSDGYTGDVADELHGLAEDAMRAVREDFELANDDPANPVLRHYLFRGTYTIEAVPEVGEGLMVGILTLAGRIAFTTPDTGA